VLFDRNGKFVCGTRWILGISSWPLCTTKSVSRARHQATPTETVTLWRVINGRPMDIREFRGASLCGVYRPGEWRWIDSNGKNGN